MPTPTDVQPSRDQRRPRVRLLGVVGAAAAVMLLTGCDQLVQSPSDPDPPPADAGDAGDDADEAAPSAPKPPEPDGDATTGEVVETAPRIVPPGAEAGIVLRTPPAGEGSWPRLAWDPVPDAQRYTVTLYAETGRATWTWQGAASEVLVGGFSERPAPGSTVGPRVHEPMTWDVLAYDANGRIIAVSGERTIRP